MNPRSAIARAVSGANLAADSRHGVIDSIIALGAVAQGGSGLEIVRAACALDRREELPGACESLPADLSGVRWGQDLARLPALAGAVRALVAWWAARERWRVTDEQLSALTKQLVHEATGSEACPACQGRGFRYVRGRYAGACQDCRATGVSAPPAVERANALGISRQAYYATWSERCDELLGVLMECDRRMMGKVRKKVGDDSQQQLCMV